MSNLWAGVVSWFQGKKTILGGGVVMAAAVAGVGFGKLDPVSALTLIGMGLSIVGASAKANRHQAELLTALQGVAQVGADVRSGNSAKAVQDAEQTGLAVATPLLPEALSAAGASLHISGATADEVASLTRTLFATTTVVNNAGPLSVSALNAVKAAVNQGVAL